MKIFLTAVFVVAVACFTSLLLALAAQALFTGESFPPPVMSKKEITFLRVPASSPISP